MNKIKKINYYSNKDVVNTYELNRFNSPGGVYVNQTESSIVNEMLKDAADNQTIADVPCGTGRFIPIFLKHKFTQISAIDYSDEMLKKCKAQFPFINTIKSDIFGIDKLELKFDWVISIRFFFHYKEKDLLLKCMSSCLKKDAFLILDTIRWSPRQLMFYFNRKFGGPLFIISDRAFRQMAIKAGFIVIEKKNIFILPSYLISKLPSFLLKFYQIIDPILPGYFMTKTIWKFQKKQIP